MRLLLTIFAAMLMVDSVAAQSLWRNFFTTNRDPIVEVVAGSNATVQVSTVGVNLRRFTVNSIPSGSSQTNFPLSSITNAGYLTNWALVPTNYVPPNAGTSVYASLLTSTAIGLADTNWVIQQIAAIGQHTFSTGVTNTGAIDGKTNNWQGWDTPTATITTNSITDPTAGNYIRNVVSTNTFTRIETGPVDVNAYLFRSGVAGTLSIHPEVYLFDTVSNTLFIGIGSASPVIISATTPTLYDWSLSVNSITHTNPFKVVISWKVDNTAVPGTILNFVSGGIYDSHSTFVQNLSSATINWSQIMGAPPRSVGISLDGGGSAITAGTKGYISVPYAGVIKSCIIMAQPSGSIEFRIWRTNSADASFPPTAVGAIGTNSLSSDNYNVDSTLSGWTTNLSDGDVLAFNIPSAATTITNCTLQLKIQQ